ncbi:MAG: glycosyltransferase family 2 protein [Patescibacteria group bacterium]|nr:glycosyltransferase family 2 protein [Patescibacteria group bacterium]
MESQRLHRLTEIIPGALVWTTILGAALLSYFAPLVAIYFIILFDLFWFFRIVHFLFFLAVSARHYRHDIKIDWLPITEKDPGFDKLYHVVFLPTVEEGVEILRDTLENLATSRFPVKDKVIVVLAGEARVGEEFPDKAKILEQEFAGRFFRLVVTVHPADVVGEIIGKGSNLNYSARQVQRLIDELGIPYEDIIVSSFDCDTAVHAQYFANLSHKFLTHPNRLRSSYQPVILFSNNIWDVSPPVRVASFGTVFWLFGELSRPEKMCSFSSHAVPWQALVDVGFWHPDIVSEDSRIFLQCLFRYDGDYEMTPMYVPVTCDAVVGETFWKSMVNLYKQQRRWAWGVEHFPYMIEEIQKHPRMPWRKKLYHLWLQTEGMYSWAVAPVLIFMLGYLPLWFAPTSIKEMAFFQNTPHTLEALMRLSLTGVLATALLSFFLLPPRPQHKKHWDWLVMIFQWALVPVTFILFGSIPAIDAQTRLMIGKPLGYNVTAKSRKT